MSNWKTVRLRNVVSILGDGLHGTPKYDKNGSYYFINGNNLSDGKIIIKPDTKRINETEYVKYKKELNSRTILVSINGTIGNVALYNGEKCILGKSACYFNILTDIDKGFVKYIVIGDNFQSYIKQYANGTTIKNVSLKVMRDYEFQLPPIEEQRRIAEVLGALDDKIECNNRINRNLEEQAAVLFRRWFVDFEFPDENGNPYRSSGGSFIDSPLGEIPTGWKVRTLGEIGTIVGGGTPSKAKDEYFTSNGIAWITPKDLSISKSKFISKGETSVTLEGYKNSSAKLMPKGTVLFSSRAPIGYIAIAQNEVSTNQGFKSVIPNNNIGTPFIYFFLKNNIDSIEGKASGSTFKEASGGLMKSL